MRRFILFAYFHWFDPIHGAPDLVPTPAECYASRGHVPEGAEPKNFPFKTWRFRAPLTNYNSLLQTAPEPVEAAADPDAQAESPPSLEEVSDVIVAYSGLAQAVRSSLAVVSDLAKDAQEAVKSSPVYCDDCPEGFKVEELPTPAPTAEPTKEGWPEAPPPPPVPTDVPEEIRLAIFDLYKAVDEASNIATETRNQYELAVSNCETARKAEATKKLELDAKLNQIPDPENSIQKKASDLKTASETADTEATTAEEKVQEAEKKLEEDLTKEDRDKYKQELTDLKKALEEAEEKRKTKSLEYQLASEAVEQIEGQIRMADKIIEALAAMEAEVNKEDYTQTIAKIDEAKREIVKIFQQVDPVLAPKASTESASDAVQSGSSLMSLRARNGAEPIKMESVTTSIETAKEEASQAGLKAAEAGASATAEAAAAWAGRDSSFDINFILRPEDEILFDALQERKLISHATGGVLTPDDIVSEAALSGFLEPGRYLRAVYGISVEHTDDSYKHGVPSSNALLRLYDLAQKNKVMKQRRTEDVELDVIRVANVERKVSRRPPLVEDAKYRLRQRLSSIEFDTAEGVSLATTPETIDLLEEEYFNA